MSDLSADARALISAAKRLDEPTHVDRVRVRAALDRRWAAHAANMQRTDEADPLDGETNISGSATAGSGWGLPLLAATAVGTLLALWIGLRSPTPAVPTDRAPTGATQAEPHTQPEPSTPAQRPADPAPAVLERRLPTPERAESQRPAPTAHPRSAGRARAGTRPARGARDSTEHGTELELDESYEFGAGRERAARATESAGPGATNARNAEPRPAQRAEPTPSQNAELAPAAARTPAATRTDNRTGPPPKAASAHDADDVPPEQTGPKFAAQAIDDELALLGEAQQALQDRRPSLALRLVQHHAFRFPRGALSQERIGVQALALCSLRRYAEARQILAELERRAPNSPLIARVRVNCGFAPDAP